jgi:hypothetical protein
MVAAFATLVVVWHHVIGPPQLEAVRQQPRPIGAVTQAVAPVPQPGAWGRRSSIKPTKVRMRR